ncbi:sporulation membrane protein YtaF [Bacillus smithii]|uniref:sporulation membrane protein YtaF n=1 Tax=Bacillus smithii TaxID=1479 RepID=UPI003D1DF6F7
MNNGQAPSIYYFQADRKEIAQMGSFFSLLLLAFAVSLDNFSTGLAYGIKQMKLPLKSVVILSCCSGVALLLAMMIGRLFGQILSPHLASLIGGIILIGLGAWALFPLFRSHQKDEEELPHEKTIFKLELKSVGLVISILKTPTKADFDRSGTITGLEAVMLGIALSLDAFGAGLGAAMLGYSPVLLSASVAIMSLIFVSAGLKMGSVFSKRQWVQRLTYLPGLLLMLIGFWKIG